MGADHRARWAPLPSRNTFPSLGTQTIYNDFDGLNRSSFEEVKVSNIVEQAFALRHSRTGIRVDEEDHRSWLQDEPALLDCLREQRNLAHNA